MYTNEHELKKKISSLSMIRSSFVIIRVYSWFLSKAKSNSTNAVPHTSSHFYLRAETTVNIGFQASHLTSFIWQLKIAVS